MKVLIISHNPTSSFQNMGKTITSLFSCFDQTEVCQLFIYPTLPNIDCCNSYFRITDRDALNSIVHFNYCCGSEIDKSLIKSSFIDKYDNSKDARFMSKGKTYYRMLARDCMWAFSRWLSKDLLDWLKKEKPTCIFLAPGDARFIYKIALKISSLLSIPIVTYLCDEYYFVKSPRSILGKFHHYLLKGCIRKTINNSAALVTISNELNNIYSRVFEKKSIILYTGSAIRNPVLSINKDISGITYLGNLAYWRDESIVDVGEVLDLINKDCDRNYKLFVYTRSLSELLKNKLEEIESIDYCGFVTGLEYEKAICNADVLLHVESFKPEAFEKVKNSISTKIADSLSSGIPLFAYGPSNIASTKYLDNNDAACICTEKSELYNKICEILDYQYRLDLSKREISVAEVNHSKYTSSKVLYDYLISIEQNTG